MKIGWRKNEHYKPNGVYASIAGWLIIIGKLYGPSPVFRVSWELKAIKLWYFAAFYRRTKNGG